MKNPAWGRITAWPTSIVFRTACVFRVVETVLPRGETLLQIQVVFIGVNELLQAFHHQPGGGLRHNQETAIPQHGSIYLIVFQQSASSHHRVPMSLTWNGVILGTFLNLVGRILPSHFFHKESRIYHRTKLSVSLRFFIAETSIQYGKRM